MLHHRKILHHIKNCRIAYENSVDGRAEVQNNFPEPYRSSIMFVWGNTPTIKEKTYTITAQWKKSYNNPLLSTLRK